MLTEKPVTDTLVGIGHAPRAIVPAALELGVPDGGVPGQERIYVSIMRIGIDLP